MSHQLQDKGDTVGPVHPVVELRPRKAPQEADGNLNMGLDVMEVDMPDGVELGVEHANEHADDLPSDADSDVIREEALYQGLFGDDDLEDPDGVSHPPEAVAVAAPVIEPLGQLEEVDAAAGWGAGDADEAPDGDYPTNALSALQGGYWASFRISVKKSSVFGSYEACGASAENKPNS